MSMVHHHRSGDDANHDDDDDDDLPECKVKRNYSCSSCDFFTQNPRHYLYHLRDVHREKVRIYECPNCLYASKHFQKLLRHCKMVHDNKNMDEDGDINNIVEDESGDDSASIELQQQQRTNNNNINNNNSSVFKCSVCSFTSKSRAQLQKHEREEHIKTKFFRCTKCSYATHMKARFTKHVKYHSMPMIKCDMCDFRTPYKWNLDRHCKNHNGRGAFRCSACNFTADIKQSLTVHEMNHHVPPVGQAAGLGVGRKRNKVGASDATAAEEAAQQQHQIQADNADKSSTSSSSSVAVVKKSKTTTTTSHNPEQGSFGPDFINPDDIIQHANGNVYIKNKCNYCSFKSAWENEMAKHEKKVHNIVRDCSSSSSNNNVDNNISLKQAKKSNRPIPNLIPIPAQTCVKVLSKKQEDEPIMSQQTIQEICAKSSNSALKDFASLFGSEDVFENEHNNKVPDLIPAYTSTPKTNNINSNNNTNDFKAKNASFFDRLKEKLSLGGSCNLTCKFCGYESKCLTEQAKHQKICKGNDNINSIKEIQNTLITIPASFITSSRCQYCRQRCKSTSDLYNHLHTCEEALKVLRQKTSDESSESELKIDESQSEDGEINDNKPHPMENRVFVWNNIEVPMDIEVDDSKYEYNNTDDNVSLDLSIRTQSPSSESSYNIMTGQDYNNSSSTSHNNVNNNNIKPMLSSSNDKIPTHGNDISIAQHKRVFKCPHCSFWASTASRFHVHIVGHLNKKPFECSLCAYRSNWRWDITKHIKLKSVRDPQHESAKVLMTDETGRRNYTKYNKYLTEIHVSGHQSLDTSGGSGTRPKHGGGDNNNKNCGDLMPKLTKAPTDFSKNNALRPPPSLKPADGSYFAKKNKNTNNNENKRTLFKCKKCNFRDASREILLEHVKGHYPTTTHQGGGGGNNSSVISGGEHQDSPLRNATTTISPGSPDLNLKHDEASVVGSTSAAKGTQAPFRCGHCNQVSNWKHVIQRHCRLKHSGDIRVVSNKNGQEKLEIEEQTDDPDHVDVSQDGIFKCVHCPYSTDNQSEFQIHLPGHTASNESVMKCHYCNYFVNAKEDLYDHLKLHGIGDPEDFLNRIMLGSHNNLSGDTDSSKRFKCLICPYVTNSKSQYTYHKQFHKPRGGEYTCSHCSYNVSKRHLLHQHLKVHGINITPQKQNGDIIDLDVDEISDEIEEVPTTMSSSSSPSSLIDAQNFADIPLVWVSKSGQFSKMFKCRYCPHVNLRKVNIQEHEKMHSVREKNPNSSRINDIEHRCTECNYVCNNAGVLSSHSKVHQGLYGTVHCLVDQVKSDEEQIRELSKYLNPQLIETINLDDEYEEENDNTTTTTTTQSDFDSTLYFCKECPARFLKDNEYNIHAKLHGVRLYYKCNYCSYSARQKPHLLAHDKVHTDEYQDRTRVLQSMYPINNNQPELTHKTIDNKNVWIVADLKTKTSLEHDFETLNALINNNSNKNSRSSNNVPLSGTELFQQKNEAELKHKQEEEQQQQHSLFINTTPQKTDPQFGVLMHGNPKFIYPTYMKNGRMKEKRYKCHKCPSAFEKREQYKVHLNLHGSKQRYNCDHCDYSVKYYANYVQHLKKHKMSSEAQAAKTSDHDNNIEDEIEDCDDDDDDDNRVPLGDQQTFKILQQRLSVNNNNNNSSPSLSKDDETCINKKLFTCPSCPYVNYRKDAVDNHQKRHISVSGIKSNHTCEHCDYSVPQVHFLRDHTKLHFSSKINGNSVGYMVCDNLRLVSKKSETDEGGVIFEESAGEFLPELDGDIEKNFNNNDGERMLVDRGTGEVTVNSDKMDES